MQFGKWLKENDRLRENPFERVAREDEKGVDPKRPRRALSPAEVEKLIAAAPPRRALVYRMASHTGLRRGSSAK